MLSYIKQVVLRCYLDFQFDKNFQIQLFIPSCLCLLVRIRSTDLLYYFSHYLNIVEYELCCVATL